MADAQRQEDSHERGALRSFLADLVRVSPGIADVAIRRKSRLLTICLLSMTVLFGCADLAFLSMIPGYLPPWPGYVLLVGTYLVNRRGMYRLASALVLAMFPIVVFGQIVLGTSANALMSLGFLTLSPLLGAILLTSRGVVLLAAVNIAGILLMPFVAAQSLSLGESVGPLAAMAISGALAVTYMRHRDQIEADRQEELRASEERLRMALDAAKMGSWDWFIQEDRTLVSPGLEGIFGLPEGMFGSGLQAYLDRVDPADRAQLREQLDRVLSGESGDFTVAHRIVLLGERVRWVEVNGRLRRDEAGKPWRMAGTILDVSERRSLESQLRQAQKLEAVGRLAGGIAHDFNNMLTVILGNVELLKVKTPIAELVEIEKAVSSAGNLTKQLLAFSRQAVLRPEVLNLNDVLGTTSTMLRRIIGEDIELEVIEDPTLFNCRVDAAQIQQILLNLATNARDAMPAGGRLIFRTENHVGGSVLQGDLGPGQYALLAVSDTGEGMDEATMARVFEPFFTTKPVGKGTGLGMAMVFGIVNQSGGRIRVESVKGQGTTFRLYFPRVDLPAESQQRQKLPLQGGTETILLVEDQDAVRSLCQQLLEREGYTVLAARSADEAESLWKNARQVIDLVLTDIVMPGRSGRSLVASLRAERPELAAVLMSGYPQGAETEEQPSIREGELVQKPFRREVLLGSVRRALDRARAMQARRSS